MPFTYVSSAYMHVYKQENEIFLNFLLINKGKPSKIISVFEINTNDLYKCRNMVDKFLPTNRKSVDYK